MATRNELELRATDQTIGQKAKEIEEVWKKAERDDREPNENERSEVKDLLLDVKTLKEKKERLEKNIAVEKDVRDLSKTLGRAEAAMESAPRVIYEPPQQPSVKSIGEQFIESPQYKALVERGVPGGEWTSGQVEIDTKGTLTTTPGTALTPPVWTPGITETLFQRLYVADLFAQGTTDSPVVKYVEETTATNAAAVTAETVSKPESALAFTERTDLVKKIATFLPVSDEMLEDAPAMQGYINERLRLFVQQAEETHLLTGTGVGIFNRTISGYARGTVDDNATAIFKAANGARGSFFLDPDALIINPANWQAIRLGKDVSGQYYGGGPFYGPYGGPQGPSSSNQFSADNLWGLRVLVTSAVGAGTALIGPFRQGAQLFRRSGLTVEASNSHGTYFKENITAIRAEERLALAVYRPTAFVQITGLA